MSASRTLEVGPSKRSINIQREKYLYQEYMSQNQFPKAKGQQTKRRKDGSHNGATGDIRYAVIGQSDHDGNFVITMPHAAIAITQLPTRGEQFEPTIFW